MNSSHNPKTPKVVGAVTIFAVVAIAFYVLILSNKPLENIVSTSSQATSSTQSAATTGQSSIPTATTAQATATSASAPALDVTTAPAVPSSGYKDGTYSASTTYSVPQGARNSVKATFVIKDGVIESVNTDNTYQDQESSFYISSFKSSVSKAVVGKKIDASFSSRIGGASLTSRAFANVISQVISQAKA